MTKIMSPSTHRDFIDGGNSSSKSRRAFVADVLSAAKSKLSSSTASTPAGAFGAALAILCASAAALWMYGGVVVERRKDGGGGGGGGGDDDAEIKRLEKDTRRGVVSLRRRFLAIFWLLRMADWLQVREKRERGYGWSVERREDACRTRTTKHISFSFDDRINLPILLFESNSNLPYSFSLASSSHFQSTPL